MKRNLDEPADTEAWVNRLRADVRVQRDVTWLIFLAATVTGFAGLAAQALGGARVASVTDGVSELGLVALLLWRSFVRTQRFGRGAADGPFSDMRVVALFAVIVVALAVGQLAGLGATSQRASEVTLLPVLLGAVCAASALGARASLRWVRVGIGVLAVGLGVGIHALWPGAELPLRLVANLTIALWGLSMYLELRRGR